MVMKIYLVSMLMLGLMVVGCKKESPKGGPGAGTTGTTTTTSGSGTTSTTTTQTSSDLKDDTFRVLVPSGATGVTQGKREEVTVSLSRGSKFKQAVALTFAPPAGVKIVPSNVTIKGDESKTNVFVEADDTATVGRATISVTGTPETGAAVSVPMEIDVKKKS